MGRQKNLRGVSSIVFLRCGSGLLLADMKSELLELITGELRARLERLTKAAKAAHDAATDPGSKAESKYDTRSLEESYLATGQARQVKELAETLAVFESFTLSDFSGAEEIGPGALVEVKHNGEGASLFFLLAPCSGGLEVSYEGNEVTLLSPDSPLYGKLAGLRVGDGLDSPPFEIIGLR